MTNKTIKNYIEALQFQTYQERLEYLLAPSKIGVETFGSKRWLNQYLYSSSEWASVRHKVIARDNGCDLALPGYDIPIGITVHHIVPITVDDVINRNPIVFDLNNLICVSDRTHKLIHYGNLNKSMSYTERCRYDTCPWRKL